MTIRSVYSELKARGGDAEALSYQLGRDVADEKAMWLIDRDFNSVYEMCKSLYRSASQEDIEEIAGIIADALMGFNGYGAGSEAMSLRKEVSNA